MGIGRTLKGRYEIRETLGQGGMGVVYRAYDTVLKTDVAIKTIRDAPAPAVLQLFDREREILVKLNHPNIVPILDIGQFDEGGQPKPYFVMPLLPGATLDKLIRNSSSQLTVPRCVDIVTQLCRGLLAAHEAGLVHRDLKPGNVFVMPDFSVEIIDFGVAHLTATGMTIGQKGTLLYMAPELLQGKQPSILSDIFALGVTTYELFTRRRPFERPTEQATVQAIIEEIPPAASDLDPAVNQSISRVIHKAMAKQPWHRFSTASEFAETLQKAYRGEPIEFFDPARIRPRIQRSRKAFDQSDYQFALEIVAELEAEGHLDPDLALLRRQVELKQRQKRIRQLLESARIRLDEEEYPLAMQKIQEVLDLEPDSAEALGLKSRIESTRSERQIEGWFRLARQHIDNNAFSHARQALQNIIQLRPEDSRALALISEVDRLEQEYFRLRKEKEELFHAAVEAYQKGEVSAALTKLDQVLEIDRRAPDSSTPERSLTYQNFYNQVRSEQDAIHNAHGEARKHLIDQNFSKALAICEQYLQKYPGHALFQALKFDVEEQQRLQLSAYIAEVDRRVESETDLQRKVEILREARDRYPDEAHFHRSHRLMRDRLELVEAIVARARHYEERAQFNEALGQWETLRTIFGAYPGLVFEMERVKLRREQQVQAEAKARWVGQIDSEIEKGEYARAGELCRSARAEFSEDKELLELEKLAQQGMERCAEAERACTAGRELLAQDRFNEALEAFRTARQLDERSLPIQTALLDCLIQRARVEMEADWQTADSLVQEALKLDPSHSVAKSMKALVEDRHRKEFLDQCVSEIRQLQAAGHFKTALARVEQALSFYPSEGRLIQLHGTLKKAFLDAEEAETRRRDLEELRRLAKGLESLTEPGDLRSVWGLARKVAARYRNDPEFSGILQEFERRFRSVATRQPTPPAEAKQKAAAASSGPPMDVGSATMIIGSGAPLPRQGGMAGSTFPPEAPPVAQAPWIPPPAKPAPKRPVGAGILRAVGSIRRIPGRWLAAGAAVVLLIVAGGILWNILRNRQPPVVLISFGVRTTPPGAKVLIGDEVRGTTDAVLQVPAGSYRLRIVKDGYRAEEIPVTLRPGEAAPPIDLKLSPLPQQLQIQTDLKEGKVWLDETPAGDLPQTGQFLLEGIAPGQHTVRIESGRNKLVLAFETAPAAEPVIQKPEVTGRLDAVLVGTFRNKARYYSTFEDNGSLDGRDPEELDSGQMEWNDLSQGAHELSFGKGEQELKWEIDVGEQPKLIAMASSGANVGTLVVEVSGADEVQVQIDGRNRGVTRGGRLGLSLEPRSYEVRVAKQGYLETNAQQATVRRRALTRLPFVLVPEPAVAAVPVPAAPPSPASSRAFTGVLRVDVFPRSAEVTFTRKGETASHAFHPPSMELPEGTYTVTARARNHTEKSETVQVMAAAPQTVHLALSPIVTPPKVVEPRPMITADWDKPWSKDGEWFTRRGGDFVLYKIKPPLGSLRFTVWIRKSLNPFSKPKVRWILDYSDPKNYILFEVDKDSYTRAEYRDGRRNEIVKDKRLVVTEPYFTFDLEVESGRFVLRYLADGKNYKLLDEWAAPDRNFGDGYFGFYLPGNDQMWLDHFSFLGRP